MPGAGDNAVFDGTSAKPATMNVNVNLGGAGGGLTVTAAYTGTITQAAGVTVTVGAVGLSQAGGTFVGSTGAITINGPFALSGGAFTATSGTMSVSGNFTQGAGTFAPNGGLLRFAGGTATIDVGGSAAYGNVMFAAGTKTIAAGNTVVVDGTLTMSGSTVDTGTIAARGPILQASTAGAGTGTVHIDGTTDQTFTGAATTGAGGLPNLVIDKPSGTLSLVGTIRTGRNPDSVSTTADLAITKAGPASAIAGDAAGIDYMLTVANAGPADNVGGFTVTDTLPDGLVFQASDSEPSCTAIGQVVTCVEPGGLAAGATESLTVHAFLVQTTTVGSALSNAATVASDGTLDPDDSNDTSAVLATLVSGATAPPPAPDTAIERVIGTIDVRPVGQIIGLLMLLGTSFLAAVHLIARRTK